MSISNIENCIPTTPVEEIEENFLRSCRNGDLGTVKQFLAYRDAKKVQFNISCKGKSKYIGWTPLHLATYFGHIDVVEHLLSRNADVNAINENGDTPLHKAAFIGRQVNVIIFGFKAIYGFSSFLIFYTGYSNASIAK